MRNVARESNIMESKLRCALHPDVSLLFEGDAPEPEQAMDDVAGGGGPSGLRAWLSATRSHKAGCTAGVDLNASVDNR
ncbi:cobalt-precorrin-6x reductase [Anopheles sinensis]|uniref:Cobalt-precorrin-6x reductase n=1 Tax=Anopheles sinensis TaxID=74873 RepID=A0A084W0F2_ANOSI|nr:cobalt-precorrin-6x reductase [Anopheles sinensis]